MNKALRKPTDKIIKLLPEPVVVDEIEVDSELKTRLEENTITVEWIQNNAPWNQLPNEGDDEFSWFRWYTQLTVDTWNPDDTFELSPFRLEIDFEDWLRAFHEYHWVERRMAYVKYGEWVARKKDELEQLHHIANFRNTQAQLLTAASKAGLSLVEKLTKRLETLKPDDIKPHNIPSFVTALNTFLSMSADAEARLLAVTDLLDYYEADMAKADIRQHLFEANDG